MNSVKSKNSEDFLNVSRKYKFAKDIKNLNIDELNTLAKEM